MVVLTMTGTRSWIQKAFIRLTSLGRFGSVGGFGAFVGRGLN